MDGPSRFHLLCVFCFGQREICQKARFAEEHIIKSSQIDPFSNSANSVSNWSREKVFRSVIVYFNSADGAHIAANYFLQRKMSPDKVFKEYIVSGNISSSREKYFSMRESPQVWYGAS